MFNYRFVLAYAETHLQKVLTKDTNRYTLERREIGRSGGFFRAFKTEHCNLFVKVVPFSLDRFLQHPYVELAHLLFKETSLRIFPFPFSFLCVASAFEARNLAGCVVCYWSCHPSLASARLPYDSRTRGETSDKGEKTAYPAQNKTARNDSAGAARRKPRRRGRSPVMTLKSFVRS